MAKHAQPRIFVTIAAPTLAAMEDQAANAGSSQIGFEWRLDYLHDFENIETRMHQMLFRLRFPQSIA
ncbi:MAG TPA: hypothetical protein VGX94_07090, partial [Terriglobia bacterium]|nr:hypothetical protein [Terriglobia bacterium]HEV2499220.1 hypothetical protein [Terriglobia bacterium]